MKKILSVLIISSLLIGSSSLAGAVDTLDSAPAQLEEYTILYENPHAFEEMGWNAPFSTEITEFKCVLGSLEKAKSGLIATYYVNVPSDGNFYLVDELFDGATIQQGSLITFSPTFNPSSGIATFRLVDQDGADTRMYSVKNQISRRVSAWMDSPLEFQIKSENIAFRATIQVKLS